MKNKIAFTYNPYIYFHSYENVLSNIRKWYTDEDIFIYMDSFRDDLNKYEKVAITHNCNFIVRENEMYYIHRDHTVDTNSPKMLEWLYRIKYTCENTESDWIVLIEDDVLIKRKIQTLPNTDCGTNRTGVGFLGGGSIFRRLTFLKIFESLTETDIVKAMNIDPVSSWAGDMMLKHLFKHVGATSERWVELAEPNYFDKTDHAVFHGYKELHKLG